MKNTESGTDWGPPFADEEYRERIARVKREMQKQQIDLLFVSSPPNITWLTGYDSIWYRRTTPTGLAIRADADTTLFFDSMSHADLVHSGTGCFDDVEFFDRRQAGPAVDTIITTLKKTRLAKRHRRRRKMESFAGWRSGGGNCRWHEQQRRQLGRWLVVGRSTQND